MNITAYIQMRRTLTPTGVGKHINQMVTLLARSPGVRLEVLTAREETRDGRIRPDSPLSHLPVTSYPLSRRTTERLWRFLGWPAVDRWCAPGTDWVYCPAETRVPVRRARTVVTAHAVYWFQREYPEYDTPECRQARVRNRTVFGPAFKHADLVFSVSQYLGTKLTELFSVDPKKIVVVGNGVEEEFFAAGDAAPDAAPAAAEGLDRPYLLAVGGLTNVKGADFLLNLAAELERRRSNLQVVTAGKGEEVFERRAQTLSNVRKLGYVGVDRLPMLMRRAVAVVHLSKHEAFGIPVVEGMAAGVPVVGSNVAALPEVMGDAGVAVDPSDTPALAALVERLRDDAAYRATLISAGRERAAGFRWSACAARALSAMRSYR